MFDSLHNSQKQNEDHITSTQKENPQAQIKILQDSQQNRSSSQLENQINLNQNKYGQKSSTNSNSNDFNHGNLNDKIEIKLNNDILMTPQQQDTDKIKQNIKINVNNMNNVQNLIQHRQNEQNNYKSLRSCPNLECSNLQSFENKQVQQILIDESKKRFSLKQETSDTILTKLISNNGYSSGSQNFQRLPFQKEYQSQFDKIEKKIIEKYNRKSIKKNDIQMFDQKNLLHVKSIHKAMRRKSKSHGDVIEYVYHESVSSASNEQDQIYEAVSKAIVNEEGELDIGDKDLIQQMNESEFTQMYALDEGLNTHLIEDNNLPNEKENSFNSQKINESSVSRQESQVELYVSKQNLKQNEKIRTYNLQNQLDLQDSEVSDVNQINFYSNLLIIYIIFQKKIAISILQKNVKSAHEIKFLQKCIEGMPLFQKHQGLFEKSNTSHHLFSQIKHVKYQKNHVIFNFGSVFCLIPHNEFKEELIAKQKKNEQMLQRLKILQSKSKQSTVQEEGKTFLDIVMLAFTQKQQQNKKQQKVEEQKQKLKDQPKINPKMVNQQKKNSKIRTSITPLSRNSTELLKQNLLFSSFLERKGIKIKQDKGNEKQKPFLARKSKDLDSLKSLKFIQTEVKNEKKEPVNQLKVPLEHQNVIKEPVEQTQSIKIQIKIPDGLSQAQMLDQHEQDSQSPQSQQTEINTQIQRNDNNKSINETANDMLQNETSKEYLLRKFPEFFMVKAFQPGESFGEIALMTKERRYITSY